MKNLSDKMFGMQSIFHHFITNTWRFSLSNTDRTWAAMNEAERREFKIDVAMFNWDDGFMHHIYGLRRYYLKEDIMSPTAGFQQLLQKGQPDPFHDVRLSSEAVKIVPTKSNTAYFADILSSSNFHAYVQAMTSSHNSKRDNES